MISIPRLVDISSLSDELDALVASRGSDDEHFHTLQAIAERLYPLASAKKNAKPAVAGWTAVAFGGHRNLDVYCHRLNSTGLGLRYVWASGALKSAWHTVNEKLWLLQAQPDGSLRRSTHTGPTVAETDMVDTGLPRELGKLTDVMLNELKGQVDPKTRALIDAAPKTGGLAGEDGANGDSGA